MRAGGFTVQQALTVEAENVVKQAVALARRRGHAQVTPLHVANTMLAASNGLLRTACLQSHSHPLQCKALELCFNVALNRLPASSSSSSLPTMLGHHHHHSQQQYPTISNALVAAFKRAQAHQRRGSIENQQQPLLAVKVELEQLIISILDDPSVSRVMREAGFSSSQVKNNVEQAVSSLELCSHQVPSTRNNNINNKSNIKENNLLHHVFPQPSTAAVAAESAEDKASKPSSAAAHDPTAAAAVKDEDVLSVIDCLLTGRKRSIVVVGECLANIDGVVRGLMDKVNKGNVPEALKEVKFISIPLISFSHHRHREEVEQKIGELTCLVRGLMDKGVILYLGDLKWITDFIIMRASSSSSSGDHEQGMMRRSYYNNYYCPVEHMITEFGRLLMSSSGMGENGKCWLMGIATFQTYMRCRSGSGSGHQRSLETLWGLHPITLPAGSLSLSLSTECGESRSKTAGNGSYNNQLLLIDSHSHDRGNEEMIQLNCCADCSAKFETEARSLQTRGISNSESTLSSLPSWLKEESKRLKDNDQNCMPVRELCKKWNKVCSSSFHKQTKSSPTFSSSTTSPSSSTSFFSCYDQQLHSCSDDVVLQQQQQQRFWSPTAQTQYEKKYCDETATTTTSFRLYISEHSNSSSKEPKQVVSNSPLLSTTTSTPNSASSSDNNNNNNMMETELLYLPRFKEFNCENLNILCNALEQKVPWQKDVIPDIAGTILQCRSGMLRRKEKVRNTGITDVKEETWLFFQGVDVQAKENIARELAKIIFGSYSKFISVALSSFSSYSTSEDMIKNKRSRDELDSSSYLERLAQAISEDPHRVFFVEDVEQADLCSRVGIKRAIQRGRINSGGGGDDQEVSVSDAIIILSCESFNCRSRACSPPVKHKSSDSLEDAEEEISPCVSLDLNLSFDDDDDDDDDQDHDDDDCNNNNNESIDDVGILENVDRRIVFRMREL